MRVQESILFLYVSAQTKIDFFKSHLKRTAKDNEGASTVEYALLIAVIVFGVVGAAAFMIPELKNMFLDIVDKIAKLAKG